MKQSSGILARFTQRERVLLLAMVLAFSIIGFVAFMLNYRSSLIEKESEIENMQSVTELLTRQGASFARRIQENAQIEAQLVGNGVQLQGFLEQICEEQGVALPSNYRTSDNTLRSGLEEHNTDATINNIEALQLSRLLRAIDSDPQLVIVKVIELRQLQRNEHYQLNLTLATYRDNQEP